MNDTEVGRLRWAAFDRLRTNETASPAELAAHLGCTVADVNATLAAQAAIGRMELDDRGQVIGSHGLTLLSTRHTLAIGDRALHTWCALDAVGIPAASGDDARVATSCGWCDQPITVTVVSGLPAGDTSLVLWLPTGPCDNLRGEFCPHANLFCDRQHLDLWYEHAHRPEGRVLTLTETADLGRQSWRRDTDKWGTGIDPATTSAAASDPADDVRTATCSCCGEQRDRLVALLCHDEIKLCPGCIGWLRSQAGTLDVTPILPVHDMPDSIRFYERAGFTVREYEPGGGHAFVHYDDESVFDLHLTEHPLEPTTNSAGCYVIVPDADHWQAQLAAAGLPVTEIADQPWEMREFTLTDPNGNQLRIGHPT